MVLSTLPFFVPVFNRYDDGGQKSKNHKSFVRVQAMLVRNNAMITIRTLAYVSNMYSTTVAGRSNSYLSRVLFLTGEDIDLCLLAGSFGSCNRDDAYQPPFAQSLFTKLENGNMFYTKEPFSTTQSYIHSAT